MDIASTVAADNISFRYRRRSPWVLRDLSIALDGRATVVIGPNGAGKSTLLKLFAAQLRPTTGRITTVPGTGFAPQRPVALPGFTVADQIRYAAWLAGAGRAEAAD